MMRRLVLVLALTLGACAPQSEKPEPVQNPATQTLPAPTPQDVAVRIGVEQNGQSVHVRANQRFAVELVGVPTAGYVWTPAQMPGFITRAGEVSGATTPQQSQPGFVGGNHWEVLIFAATGPGAGELVIEQRRPWETTEPAVGSFHVTIVAE